MLNQATGQPIEIQQYLEARANGRPRRSGLRTADQLRDH